MAELTVVLMCHNRPLLAVGAIRSILAQSNRNFRFLISDNSSNHELKKIIDSEYPTLEYISWFPGLPDFFTHFNTMIRKVDTPLVVMFHDDDRLEPDYVKRVLEQYHETPNVAGIGTNCFQIDGHGDRVPGELWFKSPNAIEIFRDPKDLVLRQLELDLGRAAPFTNYAYNLNVVKDPALDLSKGRNYCDVSFLAGILQFGPIVWINEPLASVRVHDANISTYSGVRDYKAFLTWIRLEFGDAISRTSIDEYRWPRVYFSSAKRNRYSFAAIKYLLLSFPRLIVRSRSFRGKILKKLFSY